jgi:glucose-6-phosphate isomerase
MSRSKAATRLISRTGAWRALAAHAKRMRMVQVRDLFARDRKRFSQLSLEAEDLLLDFSRQRLTSRTLALLIALAREAQLEARIAALLAGEPVNNTENRPALHTALRRALDRPLLVGGRNVMLDVKAEREKLGAFVRSVHEGQLTGHTGKRFDTVINIGIGGSDLGPVMTVEALARYRKAGLRVHFASNIDGCDLADAITTSNPESTLVIVCSKTFTTLETMTNARRAREWIAGALGEAALPRHFAAVSVNQRAMDEFGVGPALRFTMWDWVGGRYSVWSSIGVALALAVGSEQFLEFLGGGRAIDEHFATAPLDRNLPVLLGLVGIWNRNFLGIPTHAVLPYDRRLHRFPAYLQQLEMESNGKRVTRDGREVEYATGAVLWGEPGSNAQHSFFQLLHQGTADVVLDFVAPVQSSSGWQDQQDLALANCFAQAQALMAGQSAAEARRQVVAAGLDKARIKALLSHKIHPGNRPSSLLLFQRLDPATLGKLVALYEHKVYVQSVIWDINPFDQWGVELGKKLADKLIPAVSAAGSGARTGHELASLLDYVARWR